MQFFFVLYCLLYFVVVLLLLLTIIYKVTLEKIKKSLILFQTSLINVRACIFCVRARLFYYIYTLICLSSLVIYVYLSKNLIYKANAGGALCGGRSPTPKRLQCRCGALDWRTSPHVSVPQIYANTLLLVLFTKRKELPLKAPTE